MNRIAPPMFAVMSLAVVASGWAGEPQSEEHEAIAEIEKLGGKVLGDETMPGKPVIDVHLPVANLTDADLERLKGLTKLETLNLERTKVTDVGLEHLGGLANLRVLYLRSTKVSGDGVTRLRQTLPNCKVFR